MKKIVFATNNPHKLREVRQMLSNSFEVVSLEEIGCFDDIPETADTLDGNALIKARYVFERFGLDCFADDTGLEVAALNGAPGVYSARYAGEECSPEDNMNKLLAALDGESNRSAHFRTCIALIEGGEERLFHGVVEGSIATERSGAEGFGYDPIFIPEGYSESFADLGSELKNQISHRARAVKALCEGLGAV